MDQLTREDPRAFEAVRQELLRMDRARSYLESLDEETTISMSWLLEETEKMLSQDEGIYLLDEEE